MANIKDTSVDRGSVVLCTGMSRDVTLRYLDAANEFVEGTLLARNTDHGGDLVVFNPAGDAAKGDREPIAVLTFEPENKPAAPAVNNTFRSRAMFTGDVRAERLRISPGAPGAGISASVLALLNKHSQLNAQRVSDLTDRS